VVPIVVLVCSLITRYVRIMFQGNKGSGSAYYLQQSYPPGQQGSGGSATLPRGSGAIRAYSPANKPVSQAGKTRHSSPHRRAIRILLFCFLARQSHICFSRHIHSFLVILCVLHFLLVLLVSSTPLKPQRIYQEIGPRDSMMSPPNLRSPTSPVQRPQSTPPRPPERWAFHRSRDLYSGTGLCSNVQIAIKTNTFSSKTNRKILLPTIL